MAQETGVVNEKLEAIIALSLVNGAQLDCIIDTGFDGTIMLPRSFVDECGLPSEGSELFQSVSDEAPFIAEKVTVGVNWLGQQFDASGVVSETGFALIGTELLIDCRLMIDYVNFSVLVEKINF